MHLTARDVDYSEAELYNVAEIKNGKVICMGLVLFILLAASEIILAVRACRTEKEKKQWRRERLIVRAAQAVLVIVSMLISGQKWRFVPALGFLALLLVIAALKALIGRKKDDGLKKKSGAIVSCVLSVVMIALLLVPAFVFTGYEGLPVSGSHEIAGTSAILVDSSRTDPFEQDGSFREVPVHFYYPADAAVGERFPLVVFSHGAFGYYQSNTSTYMELASNGYVVAALDHPHHAFFTQDTAGKTVIVDMDFFNTAMTLGAVTDAQTEYDLYVQWMELRTGDMNFALDELKAAAQSGAADESWFVSAKDAEAIRTVLGMTDAARIGVMGHSMGGAAAVAVGRERSDVSAVIDVDGTMLSEYTGVSGGKLTVRDDPYGVPVLEFVNWENYSELPEYIAAGNVYPNDVLIRSAADGYSVSVRGTLHMDYTDLPLLSPTLGKMLGSGERSTEETLTIVNSLVLNFFDCYLKGEGAFSVQDVY